MSGLVSTRGTFEIRRRATPMTPLLACCDITFSGNFRYSAPPRRTPSRNGTNEAHTNADAVPRGTERGHFGGFWIMKRDSRRSRTVGILVVLRSGTSWAVQPSTDDTAYVVSAQVARD